MKSYIIILITFLGFFYGCNKNKSTYQTNHKKVEKDTKRELIKVSEDTTKVIYYENGSVIKKGFFINDTIKIGKWSFYNNSRLKRQVQYLNIDNTEYVNQYWLYDEDGEILGGSFYELVVDKEKYNFESEVYIKIFTPYSYFIDVDSELFFIYPRNETLKKDLSNRDSISYDTIWNAYRSHPEQFKDSDSKFFILSKIKIEKNESLRLNGILIERGFDKSGNLINRYREMYLEEEIYVKKTIINSPS